VVLLRLPLLLKPSPPRHQPLLLRLPLPLLKLLKPSLLVNKSFKTKLQL